MDKKNTRPLWYITITLLVIALLVGGFWAVLSSTIKSDSDTDITSEEVVEEVVEEEVEEDVETPTPVETEPDVVDSQEEPENTEEEEVGSEEVEIDIEKIRGERGTLSEEEVERRNKVANVIVENFYDTNEVNVRPIEGVKFDRINKPDPKEVDWGVTYVTKGELIWWLNEHVPTMFTDVNYQVTFNTETMTIQVRGKGDSFRETNEVVKEWIENMYEVSEYGLQEIPYTLLFQEIV